MKKKKILPRSQWSPQTTSTLCVCVSFIKKVVNLPRTFFFLFKYIYVYKK